MARSSRTTLGRDADDLLGSISVSDMSGLYLERCASGDLLALARELRDRVPFESMPLVARLVVLDAELRIGAVPFEPVVGIVSEVAAAEVDSDLRLWASALVAEHHLWRFQLESVLIAQGALATSPQPVSDLGRYAIARLQRIAALARLFDGSAMDPQPAAAFALLGLDEELAATTILRGVVVTTTVPDGEFVDALRSVQADGVQAVDRTVDRKFLGWFAAGWAALWLDDHEGIGDAVDGMRSTLPTESLWFGNLLEVFETIRAALVGASEAEVTERVDRLVQVSRDSFLNLPGFMIHLARALLDRNLTAAARRVLDVTSVTGFAVSAGLRLIVQESAARLRLLESPSPAALADVAEVMEGWDRLGLEGPRSWCALRAAHDCEQVGLLDDAARFRAAARLDAAHELGLTGRLFDIAPPRRERLDRLELLGPDAVAVRSGTRVHITGIPALLLAVLAIERRPVGVENLMATLWPDETADTARSRLKVHLYRLRRLLGLGPDELVARDRTGLVLQTDGRWVIDLWDVTDGLVANDVAVFDEVRVDLLDVQFPFVDRLEGARRGLRLLWIRSLGAAVAAGRIAPELAMVHAERTRMADPDLLYDLADDMVKVGGADEARRLRDRADQLVV